MSNNQRGVVLVIALIMLAVVTLIGTVSANIVMGNLRVVQNIEARAAASSAAISAMQEAIMTSGFLEGEKAFTVGCKDSGYTRCFDMTGDGSVDDMSVALSEPECISVQPVLTKEVAAQSWADTSGAVASCYRWTTADGRSPDTANKYSDCVDVLWEVTLTASDETTGATVVTRQGLTTRTSKNLIEAVCPLNG